MEMEAHLDSSKKKAARGEIEFGRGRGTKSQADERSRTAALDLNLESGI